jgi:hypothetical protein
LTNNTGIFGYLEQCDQNKLSSVSKAGVAAALLYNQSREEGEGDIEANTRQASQVASLKGAPTMRDAKKVFQEHEQLKQCIELKGSRSTIVY